MSTKETESPPTLASLQAKVSELVDQMKLADLRLVRGHCEVMWPLDKKLSSELVQSAGVQATAIKGPNSLPLILARLAFSIVGKTTEGTEALKVEAVFGLTYAVKWNKEPSEEDIGIFSQAVGVNNAWPYWREFVQSSTVRMGMPPLIVPLLRLDEMSFALAQTPKQSISRRRTAAGSKRPLRKR